MQIVVECLVAHQEVGHTLIRAWHPNGSFHSSQPRRKVAFIEPMECLAVTKLPVGPEWVYEIKLDGYRAVAIKSDGKLNLISRRRNSFNSQYPLVLEALADLPDDTVIDGEVVALDESARPDFNLLQRFRSQASRIHYFVFDLLIYNNRDLTRLSFIERCHVLNSVLKFSSSRIRLAEYFETPAENMLSAARAQRLEGVIAKRKDSTYQPGQRTRIVGQVPPEFRPGVGYWRLHSGNPGRGCHRCWVLPR
jgi:bifunctional non-homologous end joining protein LigD